MSEPKQEVCDRAAIVVARMVGWVPEEKRGELAAHIRIALDTEVEAGGPYINNGWNRRALSPPEPTEGMEAKLRQALILSGRAVGAALSDKVSNEFLLNVPAEVAAVVQKLRGAMPLQDHGWRDISTAPKDGTLIIAYAPKAPGEKIRTTWWRRAKDKRSYIGWGEFNINHWPPTHWKPVPAAPAMVAEERLPASKPMSDQITLAAARHAISEVIIPPAVTPLDLVWENVNALGGVPASPIEEAQCETINQCLAIIESFGGNDPAAKRACRVSSQDGAKS